MDVAQVTFQGGKSSALTRQFSVVYPKLPKESNLEAHRVCQPEKCGITPTGSFLLLRTSLSAEAHEEQKVYLNQGIKSKSLSTLAWFKQGFRHRSYSHKGAGYEIWPGHLFPTLCLILAKKKDKVTAVLEIPAATSQWNNFS